MNNEAKPTIKIVCNNCGTGQLEFERHMIFDIDLHGRNRRPSSRMEYYCTTCRGKAKEERFSEENKAGFEDHKPYRIN